SHPEWESSQPAAPARPVLAGAAGCGIHFLKGLSTSSSPIARLLAAPSSCNTLSAMRPCCDRPRIGMYDVPHQRCRFSVRAQFDGLERGSRFLNQAREKAPGIPARLLGGTTYTRS